MDFPVQYTLDFLKSLLPPQLLTSLEAIFLSPSSPIAPLVTALSTLLSALLAAVPPLLDRVTALLSSSPNIVAAAFLLVLAVVILQILAFVRRILVFATRLALRVAFWAVVGVLISVVWQRGAERTARDAVAVGMGTWKWVAGVGEIWWREFERAQAQAQGGSVAGSATRSAIRRATAAAGRV